MRKAKAWILIPVFVFATFACPPPELTVRKNAANGARAGEGLAPLATGHGARVGAARPASTEDPGSGQDLLDAALENCRASQAHYEKGDIEEAIAALDDAYDLILGVDTSSGSDLVRQKDDIRLTICKRLLLIHSAGHILARGSHTALPLEMNREVRREIELFKGAQREFFENSYRRSGRFRHKIVERLEEAGLPAALSWLPLIESGFKLRAFSPARALGLWQFIPTTGYRFGLGRDEWIDERMDVHKATGAAIAYLKELHDIFGDWITVLAAYNCGESRVLGLIRSQKIDYLDDFWDLYERLPAETRRYVPRFLAALHILKEPEKHGFDLPEPDSAPETKAVRVTRQVHLKAVAGVLGVSREELAALNPELRRGVTPPGGYELVVPADKAGLLAGSLGKVPTYKPSSRRFSIHVIRRGETLWHLARRYHVSIGAIARANRIRRNAILRIGQKLKIPRGKTGSRRLKSR